MRRTKEEKQRTHERIVEEAARQFRAEGTNGIGIAELMGQVNLTHGGFYAHFKNKDALVAEACREGMTETKEHLMQAIENAPEGEELTAIIDSYLSTRHRDNPASGCVMPSLGADIARHPAEVRSAFTEGYERLLQYLAPFLPEDANQDQRDEAIVLISGLVGSLVLARATDDPELSERILSVNRDFYKRTFSE